MGSSIFADLLRLVIPGGSFFFFVFFVWTFVSSWFFTTKGTKPSDAIASILRVDRICIIFIDTLSGIIIENMIRAGYKDREHVVNILVDSFDANKSVNYIVKQDGRRVGRIRKLMEYSFDTCYLYGEVFLSGDKNGCALILFPDKKRTTLRSVLADARLALSCVGLFNIKKVLKREAMIKAVHPTGLIYYLWFIGVTATEQHRGIGSMLLQEIIKESIDKQRPVYLETSTLKNIPWYERFGFTIYNQLDVGYRLCFLKRDI